MLPGMMPVMLGRPSPFFKLVYATTVSAFGTSHVFNGVNFGPEFDGRRILALLSFMSKESGATPATFQLSNYTVGGADLGTPSLPFYQAGSGSTIFMSNSPGRSFATKGSSGTITVDTPVSTRAHAVVFAISGYGIENIFNGNGGFSAGALGLSTDIDIPADGMAFAAAVKANTNAHAWTNLTERYDISPLAGYRVSCALDIGLSMETDRTISFTGAGSAALVMGGQSFERLPA